jgi:hypothetical protein
MDNNMLYNVFLKGKKSNFEIENCVLLVLQNLQNMITMYL